MKKLWNNPKYKRTYLRVFEWALGDKRYNFTPEELDSPYLDKLSKQTKSHRLIRMITLAYYLGKLKGISEVDEGETPISLSEQSIGGE